MNKNKILIITVLVIFCLGISLSAVNATHIVKAGKYKAKLTDKQYNYLKKVEEVHNEGYNNDEGFTVKTGKYYTYKKPIYKNKKVKKRKYVYKYKLYYKSTWDPVDYSWHDSNSYNPKTPKGYKYVGSTYKTGNGWSKAYYKYRSIKKHSYWTTKK